MASHPIAGTEFSGPKAALNGMFKNQTQIFCEVDKTDPILMQMAYNFISAMEMNILEMSPEEHDKHIAYVSHLSHITSFMLGKTVIDKEEKSEKMIYQMAGSGFASTVRLAKSNPVTWTSIFKHNQENIIEVLEQYIENLNGFKSLLEKQKYNAIFDQLDSTNKIKEILEGITINYKYY